MAYEFKKLSNVSAVDSVSDNTNVLIEENGTIKKVSKSAVGETAEKIIGKIAEVATIDSTSNNTNVIIEENGEIKRVSKSAVGETAESVISKIAEVPSTTSVTDTTNVLIEEDGEIKKAPKSAVHGKRELVYEFTPGIDADGNPVTDVFAVTENLEGDLSWLTTKSNDYGFEIIATHYCAAGADDGEGAPIILPDTTMTASFDDNYNYMTFFKNPPLFPIEDGTSLVAYSESYHMYINNYWNCVCARVEIDNGIHVDFESGGPIFTDNGGVFMYEEDNGNNPIKSIKIYKITY